MVFGWFRQRREPASGASPTSDISPAAMLHGRISSSLGQPGIYLCRPIHGCRVLAAGNALGIASWGSAAGTPRRSDLALVEAGRGEHYLLLADARPGEQDILAFGLLPTAVVTDSWRLANVLQHLFDANLSLDPPPLPALPSHVLAGTALRPDHLRELFVAAAQQLVAAGPDQRTAAARDWWQRATDPERIAAERAALPPSLPDSCLRGAEPAAASAALGRADHV